MSCLLSILIPTLPEPESYKYLTRLNSILDPQIAKFPGLVEKCIDDRPRTLPTGTKRNSLIDYSVGEYFSQIDVDDVVPDYYVEELLKGIETEPDVLTFKGYMTTNGEHRREFTIKLGEKYEERNGEYFRYPNHLSCLKRSAVESVKFRPIWVQEDYFYATEIRDKGLLKSEYHIDKVMYVYEFVHKAKQSVYQRRNR